jgi:hypothetical protein
MSEVIARPVVKNKFWIVESAGQKIATIQAVEDGGFVYVQEDERERFPTIKTLSKKYNIEFAHVERSSARAGNEVYGYPCSGNPQNQVFDVQRKLPIYTKTVKSKSFFCAGYYIIKFSNQWVRTYSPKLITLNRYDFQGPFATVDEQQIALEAANAI